MARFDQFYNSRDSTVLIVHCQKSWHGWLITFWSSRRQRKAVLTGEKALSGFGASMNSCERGLVFADAIDSPNDWKQVNYFSMLKFSSLLSVGKLAGAKQ